MVKIGLMDCSCSGRFHRNTDRSFSAYGCVCRDEKDKVFSISHLRLYFPVYKRMW